MDPNARAKYLNGPETGLFHKGRVTDVVPALELFWILDARTGTRKLLDPEALEIRHVEPAPVTVEVSAKPQPPAKPLAPA